MRTIELIVPGRNQIAELVVFRPFSGFVATQVIALAAEFTVGPVNLPQPLFTLSHVGASGLDIAIAVKVPGAAREHVIGVIQRAFRLAVLMKFPPLTIFRTGLKCPYRFLLTVFIKLFERPVP